MSNGYVIEIDEVAAGLLIREGAGYAFHAVDWAYRALEGAVFDGPYAAERAVRLLNRPQEKASRPAARPQRRGDGGWAGSMLAGAPEAGAGGADPAWA